MLLVMVVSFSFPFPALLHLEVLWLKWPQLPHLVFPLKKQSFAKWLVLLQVKHAFFVFSPSAAFLFPVTHFEDEWAANSLCSAGATFTRCPPVVLVLDDSDKLL